MYEVVLLIQVEQAPAGRFEVLRSLILSRPNIERLKCSLRSQSVKELCFVCSHHNYHHWHNLKKFWSMSTSAPKYEVAPLQRPQLPCPLHLQAPL